MSELLARESSRLSTADEASPGLHPGFLGLTEGHHSAAATAVAELARHRMEGSTGATSVILAVASPALLCGLESLVSSTPGMWLAGSANTMPELLHWLVRTSNGVALIDPFLDGQTDVRALINTVKAAAPSTRCVFITDEYQPHLVSEAVKGGASGFVGASAEAKEIRNALVDASRGRRYIAPMVAARLAESLMLEELTSREMDVLTLLARGECNKTIARVLGVTVGTVKTHVRAIMNKLDSRSRTEAALKACRFGLVGLNG
jgi:two-component system NarL family response regulator